MYALPNVLLYVQGLVYLVDRKIIVALARKAARRHSFVLRYKLLVTSRVKSIGNWYELYHHFFAVIHMPRGCFHDGALSNP